MSGLATGRRPGWAQSASDRETRGVPGSVPGFRSELEEPGVENVHERDVEPVEPDHGCVPGVGVSVPGPGRGEQEIAAPHRDGVSVDDRPDPFAVHHEPERALAVTMGRRDLARPEVLDRGPQRRGRVGQTRETGIRQRDRAPFAATADRDERARSLRERVGVPGAPAVGSRPRLGRDRHQRLAQVPQRHQPRGFEVRVEPAELGVVAGAGHRQEPRHRGPVVGTTVLPDV